MPFIQVLGQSGGGNRAFECGFSLVFTLNCYIVLMGSGPSKKVVRAMELVRSGMTPYAAALKVRIALSTIYRSKLYKEWKHAKDHPDPGTDGGDDSAR